MSSHDLFNFLVDSASHDMVMDAGRASLCRLKFKGQSLSTKCTTNEGPFESMSFSKKQFEDFNEKKFKYTSNLDKTTIWNTRPLKTTIEYGLCKQ